MVWISNLKILLLICNDVRNDVRNIKNNPKLLIPADKTKYLYKLTTDE